MPPKKSGVKDPVIIIDGFDTSELAREQLEHLALSKKVELDRVREERNYFQQERDKIRTFWDITKTELDKVRASIRNLEKSIEEARENNELLLKDGNQEIKLLLYDETSTIVALQTEDHVFKAAALEEHIHLEQDLLNEKRKTKSEIRAKENVIRERVGKIKKVQAESLKKLKVNFAKSVMEINTELEKKLQVTITELIFKHKSEISETKERKNKQISELGKAHLKSYDDLKTYYNDLTSNNLGLISSIRAQIAEMQDQRSSSEKVSADAKTVTRRLKEILAKAEIENKELSRQMGNYDRDKAALASKKHFIIKVGNQYEILKHEYEELQSQFDVVEKDRNELKEKFSKCLQEVRNKANRPTLEMRTKIATLEEIDESPTQIRELLLMRDIQVEELQHETARLSKAHNDLLATYKAKLAKLGFPTEELEFKPLKPVELPSMNPLLIGLGPAGLVGEKLF